MPGSLRLRRAALAGVALASALVALVQPDAAQAHAFLVRSEPEAGSRLATAPDAIVFHFTESFVPASERIVLREGADVVETRPPTRKGTVLRQPLPPGLRGVLVVNWRVLSDDGHISVGEFAFAVGSAGALPKASSTSSDMPWPEVLASWLFFAGLALVLGGLTSETFVWRRIRAFHAGRAGAPASAGLAVATSGSVLTLILLAGSRAGGGFATGLDLGALGEALDTRPGALTAGVVATLAAAAVLVASSWTRPLALLPLLAAAVLTSLRGHSGTSGHWWAVAADSVHLAGAALWAGALAHLVLVLGRAGRGGFRLTLVAGARRYAGLALPTVLVVMVSGIVTALAEFRSVGELLDTGYGRTLLVKGGIVALALGLAFAARRGALPADSRRTFASFGHLSAFELAALALVPLVLALVVPSDPVRLIAFCLFLAPLAYILIALRRIVRDRGQADPRTQARRYALVGVAAVFALFASGAVASLARSQGGSTPVEGDGASIARALLIALAVAVALAALARMLPQSREARPPLLRRLTSGELVAVACSFVAVAVLVNVAPPRSSAAPRLPELGPPPVEGRALRLGALAGNLSVGLTAGEQELRFDVVLPSGPVEGARLTAEAKQPGKLSADLYPRPCGPGCFTIRFRLPEGKTTLTARVAAPGWEGGSARFEVVWPPGRERPALLGRVREAMEKIPELILTESVTSGPGSSGGPLRARMSGPELLDTELYLEGAVDVRVMGRSGRLTELAFALTGSSVWYRMWIDERYLVRRETIVSPGHLIERTFAYPGS